MACLYDVVVHHIIVRGELKMFRSKHKHILCYIDMVLSFLSFVAIIAGRNKGGGCNECIAHAHELTIPTWTGY